MTASKNIIGKVFGKLTVVAATEQRTPNGQVLWSCKCACGNETIVNTGNLQCGRTKSCGCLQRRRGKDSPQFKHGLSQNRQSAAYKKYQRECFDKCRYGLEPGVKQAVLKAQDGKCAICGYKFGQKIGDAHVDHDHKTGKVRGLLCSHCNRGLGYFRDKAVTLSRAAFYLTHPPFKFANAR
jgi:hypothetical protein